MQLNITTDYAIRTVLYLGIEQETKTAKEISEEMCIPQKYLIKVLMKLKKRGLVRSFSGQGGGYLLTKGLADISLKEILQVMETTILINRCMEDDGFCSRNAAAVCPVRKFYCCMQKELEEKYLSISLENILELYGEQNEKKGLVRENEEKEMD